MSTFELQVSYVNVFTDRFAETVSFFKDKLGFETETLDDSFGYASFRTKTIHFAVVQTDQSELVGRHTGLAFEVDDLDQTYEELTGRGVEFSMAPTDQPWGGKLALMLDPAGNVYYLDPGHQ